MAPPRRPPPSVVAILAAGGSQAEAAAAGGVSARTVRRWVSEDPLLRFEIDQMRSDALDAATGRLANAASNVAARMIDLALLPHSGTEAVTLRACALVLEHATRLHGDRQLEERLDEIEEVVVRWKG